MVLPCLAMGLFNACAQAQPRNDVAPDAHSQAQTVYLFPYFRGNGESGVYLAVSEDGLNFRVANFGEPVFTPPQWPGQNLTRDPSIVYHDGAYHMVWTSSWSGKVFGYASSPDMVNWSTPKSVTPFPASLPDEDQPHNARSPEIQYDSVQGDYFIIFSSTTSRELNDDDGSAGHGDHRMYVVRTSDFETFTPAKIFFDPGYNSIDAHVVFDDRNNDAPADDRWVMVYKNESSRMPGKNLWLATRSARSDDDWQLVDVPIAGPGGMISPYHWTEGPSLVKTDDGWMLYWDEYDNGRYAAASSADLASWTDLTDKLDVPVRHPRHGTVFKADASTLGFPMPDPNDTQLLLNGGFEFARNDKPSGWSTNVWAGEPEYEYAKEGGRENSPAVAVGSETGTDAAWSVRVGVKPRTRYQLSGWVRTRNVDAGSGVGALLNVSGIDRARTRGLTGTNGWTKLSTTFNSGNNREVQINCLFGGWGQSTGAAWYDDISLEPVE